MPMARPRIGICSAIEQARWAHWDRQAFLTPRSYVDHVQRANGLALLLPIDLVAVDNPGELLDQLDGLLLAGGADVDPGSYGAQRDRHTVGTKPERDAFEIALVRAAVERDMPFLGICRGMQVLNVAAGGTLIQHLPDHYGHGDHRRSLGSFDNADHDVRLKEGSLVHRVTGELVHKTYSHHHQGIDRIGDGLEATGWSVLDDLVEVLEVPGRRFVLGVQWHPEADDASPVVGALVEASAGVRA
jgi:putative glutamine amidotransferase